MDRRLFIQTLGLACVGAVSGCKTTVPGFQGQLRNNKIAVDKTQFADKNVLSVQWQDQTIGLVKITDSSYSASLLVCSHRGCGVDANETEFICPCHGARFTHEGKVTKGPATQDLTTFETSVDRQFVYIHLI